MDWIIGLQKAIDYIEDNLTETIDYEMVAAQSFSSSYHFQRVFSILCGFTIGEYIRSRRLSLAGTELAMSDAKVIDVALKYGYESPDSFAKAFQKFHGILPSQARNDGSNLKSFSRLVRYALQGMAGDCSIEYAVVSNIDDGGYDFSIGTIIPVFFTNHLEKTVGEDNAGKLTVQEVVERKYLIVETQRSATCIQEHLEIRKRAITEWFTESEYQLANAPEITLFHYDRINKDNSYVELWLPIERVQ